MFKILVVAVLAISACVVVATACDSVNTCDTSAAAGLIVTVTQGENGPPLCDAEVTVSDGVTSEKVSATGTPCVYTAAYEKPGTYTISATKSGMTTETKTGIVVDKGECHVIAQQVTIAVKLKQAGTP